MFESMNILPEHPGEYNVIIDGIMSYAAIYYKFDGKKWIIPGVWSDREFYWWKD